MTHLDLAAIGRMTREEFGAWHLQVQAEHAAALAELAGANRLRDTVEGEGDDA